MSRVKRKSSNKYSGGGFFQSNYPVPRKLYRYLWSLTEDIKLKGKPQTVRKKRKKYHRFITHVFMNMRTQVINQKTFQNGNECVPIYSRLIENKFGRKFRVRKLRKKIIKIKGHNTLAGNSREFSLKDEIYEKALRIEFKGMSKFWNNLLCEKKKAKKDYDLVNLVTGRLHERPKKSALSEKCGNIDYANLPKLINKSIKSLSPSPFNPKYIRRWVKKLRNKYKYEVRNFKKIREEFEDGSAEYKAAEKDFVKARGKYLNDFLSLMTITSQNPKKSLHNSTDGDSLCEYKAAYSIQGSGRISEIRGGFQNASRYFKYLFYRHVPNIYNYDLKNSQATMLMEELEKCGFQCSWLKKYIEEADVKKELAATIGISVDLWKDCFYALIFGAEAERQHGAIYENIYEYFRGDLSKTKTAYRSFKRILKELLTATKKWRDYLYESDDKRYHYHHDGFKYWKNACGMHFKDYGIKKKNGNIHLYDKLNDNRLITSKPLINRCKRRLAAFMLQGKEACFIHNLTILCHENNIPVYKNEHDGIITGKNISEELIDAAALMAKVNSPHMEIKELCPKEQKNEWKKYVKEFKK